MRCKRELRPVGGDRDKVFPPTYVVGDEGGIYAEEARLADDGEHLLPAVLLDSVASQANRMEEALEWALRDAGTGDVPQFSIPLLKVDFSGSGAPRKEITALSAPHRVFDAIFRDSKVAGNGQLFSESEVGQALGRASIHDATPLFEYSPTDLLFGAWNSHNTVKGNAKFARAIVSEIVGYTVQRGVSVGGRIDPLEITRIGLFYTVSDEPTTDEKLAHHDNQGKPVFKRAGEEGWTQEESEAAREGEKLLYRKRGDEWTARESEAARDKKGEPVRYRPKAKTKGVPSEVGHGNIAPSIPTAERDVPGTGKQPLAQRGRPARGGVTMEKAEQTTVLSFAALRRLQFPTNDGRNDPARNKAARAVLAALGLVAVTAYLERNDYFLRSRCDLYSPDPIKFQLVKSGQGTNEPESFSITLKEAVGLLQDALTKAGKLKPPLAWKTENLPRLVPQKKLVDAIAQSLQRGLAEEDQDEEPS